MSNEGAIVYVVDDDPAIRKALDRSLGARGYTVALYEDAESFLNDYSTDRPGCLVLDVRMSGMNGLELQEKLSQESVTLPIIFITGHGDIPMSVRAIKQGAIEFLEKPYPVELLLERINEALVISADQQLQQKEQRSVKDRFETLTKRERDVMALLVEGAANTSNKEIARELNISFRTVDDHRSHVMAKMQARSMLELVDMARLCGIYRTSR